MIEVMLINTWELYWPIIVATAMVAAVTIVRKSVSWFVLSHAFLTVWVFFSEAFATVDDKDAVFLIGAAFRLIVANIVVLLAAGSAALAVSALKRCVRDKGNPTDRSNGTKAVLDSNEFALKRNDGD